MSKIILVTGASRGIGNAIVKESLSLSDNVIVYGVARNGDALETLKKEVGGRFHYFVADVSSESDMNAVIQKIVNEQGRLDSVIANAGVLDPVGKVGATGLSSWRKLFEINFFSVVNLVTLALPYLEKCKGSAIFVSSGASTKPYYGWGAYGSSKAAINHLAMTLASENDNIRTIAVAPGVVDTRMQDDIRDKFGPSGMTQEALQRFTDLKEKGELLDPKIPGRVYAKLAIDGIPSELNGEYVRYNDNRL
ncbi:Uncharacterized protein RNJ44_03970 [Nakaseomyces bracarensis]|uniref:Uncharacterized protein n=1 Tax=Nakaseomyces bracarensis TaxID=273131 RepID=A0ABR4NYG3_9SACH